MPITRTESGYDADGEPLTPGDEVKVTPSKRGSRWEFRASCVNGEEAWLEVFGGAPSRGTKHAIWSTRSFPVERVKKVKPKKRRRTSTD